jgi:hypothetical protein
MEAIFESLVDTGWGAIILGAFILIAILIEFFNKPKI